MDKIILSKVEFYGYHGVFPEENKLGQRFYVDVELRMPLDKPGRSDRMEDSVSYAEVYELIKPIVEGKPFKLIEALAEAIASALLHHYTVINEVMIRVTKAHPPFDVHCQGVAVEITRSQQGEGRL